MSEKDPTSEEREQEQRALEEREARRMEMMHANLSYGSVRGVGGIIVWGIIVAAVFGLMYYLSRN
ncbi:MAG: hypothetical protein IJT68_08570 [Lentisphaeria bacterium]|nr:hypothetical protein [Lentisphaeria bacterium]